MLEKLSQAQEELMEVVANEYINKCTQYRKIDYKKCSEFITFLYDLCELGSVETIIVRSPFEAQEKANEIMGTNKKWYDFSSYCNFSDSGWISSYEFFTRIGVIDDELFNKYKEGIDIGISDSIQLEKHCIVVEMPTILKKKVNELHCEDGPAIQYSDGYSQYYWNGVYVPEKLIMTPELIIREDIIKQNNAEVRRCFREKLGAMKYYDILSNGNGCRLLDSCIDEQNNVMKLYETINEDGVINKKVQFLECECPSTGRIYNIYPPSQNCTSAKQAKGNTFDNIVLTYRHGDVGLRIMGSFAPTEIET